MSTKAERFRYELERSGPKRAKSAPRPRRDTPVDTAQPGASASQRRAAPRKESPRVAKKAGYAFEATAGKPTRKSTRKSANRQRNDSQMRVKQRTAEVHPSAFR